MKIVRNKISEGVGDKYAHREFNIPDETDIHIPVKNIEKIEIMGKFNGATGNLNAHLVAFPDIDWLKIS